MSFEPISGHRDLYCYRQTSVKGLEFMIYFNYAKPLDETGLPNKRFSAEMPNGSFSTLKIQPTEPQDSAVYLCASSSATALHSLPLPVQKPAASPLAPSLLSRLSGLPAVRVQAGNLFPTSHRDVKDRIH